MLSDTVDRGSIERMVRQFYAMVLEDDIVGPYFKKALGDDLKNDKWYEHFKTLDSFWLMMMTGERGYMGDPFLPHVFIGELYPETFERWLKIFNETVHQFFIPEIAQKFYKKGEMLAKQFMENLEIEEE
ncbi:group III truncated hemoglobin [Sulfurovum sp.]|uniref:group III truncated hemoglobin n=1 Tax=Sulfurovum sp. TaxID=1969726 RepID=UPI002867C3AA|nr:group III truncated hemoglobin [Sulfurovum sp.]